MTQEIIIKELKAQDVDNEYTDKWSQTSKDATHWSFVRPAVDGMQPCIKIDDDNVTMTIPRGFFSEPEIKTFNFNDFYIFLNKDKLEESKRKYDAFMKKYREQHECCPKCGASSHTSTLAGYIFNSEDPESYQDLNNCTCSSCGDRHTYHERISTKQAKDSLL